MKQTITSYLKEYCKNISIHHYQSVSSTNTLLKDMALTGAPEGTVIISDQQTDGRGRMNRSFYSPSNTGIYMSILLRPNLKASDSLSLTTAAAVSVAKAIEAVTNCRADIKWVNDIYINNKKVCGILTEGSINPSSLMLDYAIVGIGINLFQPKESFPEDIKSIAGYVLDSNQNINQLKSLVIANTLNYFMEYYTNLPDKTFFHEYKKRSFILGQSIYVINGENQVPAKAIDIDSDCRLIVEFKDKTVKTLSSGEVSIKLNNGTLYTAT